MDQLSHRKADARLRLLEADGTPLPGENVRIDQTGHSFLFGCGAFDAVALMKTEDGSQRAFLQERMEKWLRLFNYGTLPFYWGRYEPEEGKTAYTVTVMKRQTEILARELSICATSGVLCERAFQ